MTRKTITVSEDVYERLAAQKDDDESWSELGARAADALEADEPQDEGANADLNAANVLTEDHIDDIAGEVERRVERTLETATPHR